jgi:hypothetical protein
LSPPVGWLHVSRPGAALQVTFCEEGLIATLFAIGGTMVTLTAAKRPQLSVALTLVIVNVL